MTNLGTIIFVALGLLLGFDGGNVTAQPLQPINPQVAQQYASDSEKADRGDPEAAYRMGEALESGRLGGLKDFNRALSFYKLAAQQGHQEAAARVAQLEAEQKRDTSSRAAR
jgi:TPR repeat protein